MKPEPTPPLVRKLSGFTRFDARETGVLTELVSRARPVEAGTELVYEGERGSRAYVITDGWAYCYKILEDGSRQVINFQLPGDFLGLRSLMLRTSDHSFATLTECRLADLDKAQWTDLFSDHPRIVCAVLWAVAREEALIVEHLASMGRRNADERTARLLCELGYRLADLGRLDGEGFTCPVAQSMLADALGLSVVHLNRTLRKLREKELIRILPRGFVVPDLGALAAEAGFDGHVLQR